jgi:AcrR family transcriptional regulator
LIRITKAPEERKEEIIAAAQKLFLEKGYLKTKVSDIVKSIGVSQGIFYYYFPSKEMVLDEIVVRYMTLHLAEAKKILENAELSPLMKMEYMAKSQHKINNRENLNIHSIKGVDIHERILFRLVTDYVPLMVEAFGKNNASQVDLKIELFVTASNLLFDPGLFQWSKEERNRRIEFMISFMEDSLDVSRGTLFFYRELMGFME